MKKRITLSFAAGLVTGALLFGGTVAFATSGILAERSAMPFFLNGSPVEVEAYVINGNSYLKLRDIAKLVDFGVFWNEASGTVSIDTMVGYTAEAGRQPEPGAATPIVPTDYSAEANSDIFSESLSRKLYNALRETVVTGEASRAIIVPDEAVRQVCWNVTAAFGTWPGYHLTSTSPYTYCFTSSYPATYEEAASYCQPFIDGLTGLTDREKVRQIAFFVCDRLTYEAGSTSSPRTALVDDAVHKGNCMSYAHNFLFLCDLAGIPCVFQHSDIHQWNEVYIEGKWRKVDVTSVDCGNDVDFRVRSSVLWDDDYSVMGSSFRPAEPEVAEFVKEVLVPGSTE